MKPLHALIEAKLAADERPGLMLLVTLMASFMAVLLLTTSPALASHKDDHANDHGGRTQEESERDDEGRGRPDNAPRRTTGPPQPDEPEQSESSQEQSADTSSGQSAPTSQRTADPATSSTSTTSSGWTNSPNAGCGTTHHSDTGHGANQGTAYDPNCQGLASGNGQGGGNATGRPCAGCVGNADAKNPGAASGVGQMPDGSDRNRGYECDGNQGIGKTNPAHTGCVQAQAPPEPPGPPLTPPSVPDEPSNPPRPPLGPVPPEQPTSVLRMVLEAPSVSPSPIDRVPQAAQLPVTGMSLRWLFLMSVMLMVMGLAMLYPSRRRCQ